MLSPPTGVTDTRPRARLRRGIRLGARARATRWVPTRLRGQHPKDSAWNNIRKTQLVSSRLPMEHIGKIMTQTQNSAWIWCKVGKDREPHVFSVLGRTWHDPPRSSSVFVRSLFARPCRSSSLQNPFWKAGPFGSGALELWQVSLESILLMHQVKQMNQGSNRFAHLNWWTHLQIFKEEHNPALQQHPAPSCLQQHRCQSPGSNQAICQSLQSWDIPRGFPNASLYTSLFSPPQQGLSDHLISLQYRTGLQTVKLDAPQCTHGCKRCMWDPRECASLHPCSRLFPPHSWHNWRRSPAFRQQRCHHNQILSPGFLAPPAPTDDPEMAAGCGTGIPRRSSLPRRSSYMVLGLQVLTHPKSRKSLHSEIEPTSWQLVLQLVLK